jgi:limonene 1,2-monooxygenase
MDDLRFGVFYAPFHPLNENPTLFFERDLELIEHFDRLGYDEVWFGEHHSGGFEMSGAPELMIAAAAQRTRHIRLGAGVKSLPFHNPFIVADTFVQLDHMTRGRTMFGVGPGALPSDCSQLGIKPEDTRVMMDEALEVVMRLLAGEKVTVDKGWFRLDRAKLQLAPYSSPRMEMAVTSIRSPAGAMAAGRYGLGLLSLGGVADEALAIYNKNWSVCEDTAARHGQNVDRRNFRVAIQMHVSETREKAREEVKFGLDAWARYAKDILAVAPIPAEVTDNYGFLEENGRAVIGTPDDAIAMIEHAQKGSGGFGVVLFMAHDWADWPATMKSYELFARYVVPHFKRQLAGRRASYDIAHGRRPETLASHVKGIADADARYEAAKAAPRRAAAKNA